MKIYLKTLKTILLLNLLFFISIDANQNFSKAQKEKKIYPMGEKIFLNKCDSKIDLHKYKSINALSSYIKDKQLCKPLKEKYFNALVLYLFEVKRLENTKLTTLNIQITKDDKCPVCGMYIHKYPKWATQIFYKDKHFSFDGIKDMMKYYFTHKQGITQMLVRDYYSLKVLDAKDAYFVMGSDVYGPMGDELIAFEKKSEAQTFTLEHKGREVKSFKDITQDEVYKLDE